MIRLLTAGVVLAGVVATTYATHATYAGATAAAVTGLRLPTTAGRALAGLMEAAFAVAAIAAIAVTLRHRRFRLLAGLAGAALLTGAALTGIIGLAGGGRPPALAAGASRWPWLIGPSLATPTLGAAVAGVVAVVAPAAALGIPVSPAPCCGRVGYTMKLAVCPASIPGRYCC